MGGNALKTTTGRLAKEDYYPLEKTVIAKLSVAFPDRRINAIPTYRSKESFGDMDIVIESDRLPVDWLETVRATFSPLEMVKNGPVLSFDVQQFQIDLILTPSHYYSFALAYYSWGDLGNLTGRLAKGMGYTFGHEGLSYKRYEGDQLIGSIKLSTDFPESLAFLGFDPVRHSQGFDDSEAIFKFMVSSTYFRPESFMVDNLNHIARVRLKKRPLYGEFLTFLEDTKPPTQERNEAAHLQRGFDAFPAFQPAYIAAEQDRVRQKSIKEKFNGEIVSQLTGLSQRELGDFMRDIRNGFSTKAEFERFIVESDQAQLNAYLLDKQAGASRPSPG